MANHEVPERIADKVGVETIGRIQARNVGALAMPLVSRLLP
jgi:hypothetical protein